MVGHASSGHKVRTAGDTNRERLKPPGVRLHGQRGDDRAVEAPDRNDPTSTWATIHFVHRLLEHDGRNSRQTASSSMPASASAAPWGVRYQRRCPCRLSNNPAGRNRFRPTSPRIPSKAFSSEAKASPAPSRAM